MVEKVTVKENPNEYSSKESRRSSEISNDVKIDSNNPNFDKNNVKINEEERDVVSSEEEIVQPSKDETKKHVEIDDGSSNNSFIPGAKISPKKIKLPTHSSSDSEDNIDLEGRDKLPVEKTELDIKGSPIH